MPTYLFIISLSCIIYVIINHFVKLEKTSELASEIEKMIEQNPEKFILFDKETFIQNAIKIIKFIIWTTILVLTWATIQIISILI